MPRTGWGWLITPEELDRWVVHEDSDVLVVNKPAHVVCHPSKHGPWSSLISACRERLGTERLHMPSRLDRETSGVVVFAKHRDSGSHLQRAAAAGCVQKLYHAVLKGELTSHLSVTQPVGREWNPVFSARQWVLPSGGLDARTDFEPLAVRNGYTLARIRPLTGRMHQIRVHAAWSGHPVVGDKLYSHGPELMVEFIEGGFTPRLQALLEIDRHALHASEIVFCLGTIEKRFRAPLARDLLDFSRGRGLLDGEWTGVDGV